MRIAIFNGFRFHYEMFGTVLDFLTSRNLAFDVYSETAYEMGWFRVYERYFGSIPIHPIKTYNSSNYDYVFLLTDDDRRFKRRYGAKVIMFEHIGERQVPCDTHRRIQMRHYVLRPSSPDTWMLPVWNIGPQPKYETLHVTAIGNNCPCNPDELQPYFKDIRNIQFTFINRTQAPTRFDHQAWAEYKNVTLLENIEAEQMLSVAAKSDWLLVLPKNASHYTDSMTALRPIAYGVHTPILMTAAWKESYGLGGISALDNSVDLEKPTPEFLEEFSKQREALFQRRERLLEEALGL
jgi:hypothetical protein